MKVGKLTQLQTIKKINLFANNRIISDCFCTSRQFRLDSETISGWIPHTVLAFISK